MIATPLCVSTLQDTVHRVVERFPRERARIERAAVLIALGHVRQVDVDAFAVTSQTDASITYTVTPGSCPCVDAQRHPGQSCKHRWTVDIILVATERQRRLDARQHLSADELARLAAWKREHAAVAA
jgi:hypothetical protein